VRAASRLRVVALVLIVVAVVLAPSLLYRPPPPPPPPPLPLAQAQSPPLARLTAAPSDAVPVDVETASRKAWSGGATFHVVNGGRRVEGAFFVHKLAPVFADFKTNHAVWQPIGKMVWKHTCRRRFTLGQCVWCPGAALAPHALCLRGELTGSDTREDRNTSIARHASTMAEMRTAAHPDSGRAFAAWRSMWFTCDLAGAVPGGPGRLFVEGIPGFSASVLAPPPPQVKRGETVVCGRAVFAELAGSQLASFVDFYSSAWRFDRVIVYAVGMDRDLAHHPEVMSLVRAGKLIVVDLRDELLRVYSHLASDVVYFSHCNGQMALKMDCLARARSMGARWVLNVDVDEMLVPGAERLWRGESLVPPPGGFRALVEPLGKPWVSFGIYDVYTDAIPCENASYVGDWSGFFARTARQHVDVEWPEWQRKRKLPPFRGSRSCNPMACHGAKGGRKVAIRVDRDDFHPPGVGVHELYECAQLPEASVYDDLQAAGATVNATEYYIRHYRCLNQPLPGRLGETRADLEWFRQEAPRYRPAYVP